MKSVQAATRTEAWQKAYSYLADCPRREAYHLVVEIENPTETTGEDERLVRALDEVLVGRGKLPVNAVADTIFPSTEYFVRGVDGVYSYPDDVYPHIRKAQRPWGNYARRLLRRTLPDGRTINPLQDVVERIKSERENKGPKRACYELSVSDSYWELPTVRGDDQRKYLMGGPCLSHISLKLGRDGRLFMAVLYRHHFYTERALGNFLGLARLQQFICDQTQLRPGPVLCASTLATLDKVGAKASVIEALIKKARVEYE